jgi:hypothetical protein
LVLVFFQRCDSKFQFSYLVKYSVGTEEKNEAKLIHTAAKNVVEVVEREQKHLKISSQKFLHEQERKKNPEPLIREISQTEIDLVLLCLRYVSTTCVFIHLPTMEAADRTIILKTGRRSGRMLDRTQEPKGMECRSDFAHAGGMFRRRHFTTNQIITIRDFESGQYVEDRVHKFNVRPPELMCIDSLVQYTKWCQSVPFRTKESEFRLPPELDRSPLLDGGFRQIKFVSSSLLEVRDYLVEADRKLRTWETNRVGRRPFPVCCLEPKVTS